MTLGKNFLATLRERLRGEGRQMWSAYILLMTINISVVVASTLDRVGLDSATNLIVAMNVIDVGRYQSDARFDFGLGSEFDPTITTGPTVLLPVAALYAATSEPIVSSRVVMGLYWIALSFAIFLLSRKTQPVWLSLGLALVPASLDYTRRYEFAELQGPGDLLGEIPALLFVVLAVVLMRSNPRVAGLMLGLTIVTKLSFLVAVVIIMMVTILSVMHRSKERALLQIGQFLGAIVIPILTWELWKLNTLGVSKYFEYVDQFWEHFLSAGVHTGLGSVRSPKDALPLATDAAQMVPSAIWVLVMLILVFRFGAHLRSSLASNFSLKVPRGKFPLESITLVFAGIAVGVWWTFLNDAHYSRTVVPALILVVVGALMMDFEHERGPKARLLAQKKVESLLIFVTLVLTSQFQSWSAPSESIRDQLGAVYSIESFDSVRFSYSQDNRIMVNDLIVLGDFEPTRDRGEYAHVISHPQEWGITLEQKTALVQEECGDVIFSSERHTVCVPALP